MSESANRRGGGLPKGWVWTTIGEVAETTSGGTPSRGHPEYYGGSIPWVKSGELKNRRVTAVEEFITEEAVDKSSAKVFPKGTPLVALYGATIGQTGILGIEAATNQAICAIFSRQEAFTPEFVIYWLRYQRPQLVESGAGGAQPNISQQIIRAFHFPLAPLSEQRRIVDAIETQFTRLDAAVAALERVRANLGRYRASVLQAACEGRLVPTEAELARRGRRGGEAAGDYESADALLARILAERRARWEEERWESEIERAKKKAAQAERKAAGLPHYVRDLETKDWAHRTLEEYGRYLPKSDGWKERYDEPQPPDMEGLPELPEGWVWASLDQLTCHITSGSRGWAKYYSDQGPIFIRAQDINTDELLLENVARVDLPESVEGDRARVVKDDLLVTITGANVTKTALVRQRIAEAYVSQHVGLVRPIMGRTSQYLYQWIISPVHGRRTLERNAYGAGKPGLNLTNLRELSIALPPLAEQRRIVEEVERRLSVVQVLEQSIEANLTRAERLRQAILKKAFEGRLVDQDPDDEPASVLLARVKARRGT